MRGPGGGHDQGFDSQRLVREIGAHLFGEDIHHSDIDCAGPDLVGQPAPIAVVDGYLHARVF